MQNKEAEKVFFNSFTTDQAYDVFHSRGYQRLVREFIEIVNPMEGESLLDVGCGTGAFINQLKSMLLSVTGIDLSSNSISMALAASPWCSWTVGDA
jgi:ubiquinone/menaquinone biosynthesis C-methylase UbiE